MVIKFIKSKIVFVWMIIFLGFVVGFNTLMTIPKEDSPAITLPKFIVNTFYFGGDPKTIEKQITEKLEDEFKSITGVKKINSISSFNISTVIVDFYDDKGKLEAQSDLKDAVDKVSGFFPMGTQNSIVKVITPDDIPVYSFTVTGDYFARDLYNLSKDLEDDIKGIPGVSEVNIVGEPNKQINVFVDYNKINKFSIPLDSVVNVLKGSFINAPSDKKMINGSLYSYEVVSYEKNIEDIIARLYETDIVNNNSQSIKLSDIAKISFEEVSNRQKAFFDQSGQSSNAISFNIKVAPGTDVESMITETIKHTDTFADTNPQIKVIETFSKLVNINDMFNTFLSNFWQTGVLVFVILLIFIGLKLAVGVTIAFPLAYFITFIYLSLIGYSFNNIVSFSLVLSLGIMVDNLIVISEGIAKELKKGSTFWSAFQQTLDAYLGSIIAGTATTIAIFLPINFLLEGTIGKYIAPLSITITGTLLASLFVSVWLLPAILFKILGQDFHDKETLGAKLLDKTAVSISKLSEKIVSYFSLRWLMIIGFRGMFVFSFSLVAGGTIKTDFLPATDNENAWVNFKYIAGTSLPQNQEYTAALLTEVQTYLEQNFPDHVEFIEVNIGNLYSTDAATAASNPTADNQSYLNMKFTEEEEREYLSFQVVEKLQKHIDSAIKPKYDFISDAYTISGMGVAGGKPVGFYIIGKDLATISQYVETVEPLLKRIPGVFNVSTNLEYTNGKIRYLIDTNKAGRNMVNPTSVVQLLSSLKNSDFLPNGIAINSFSDVAEEEVILKLFTEYDGIVDDLKVGDNFVSKITEKRDILPQLKNISHLNSDLQVLIESDKEADTPLGAIIEEIENIMVEYPLPAGLSFRYNDNINDQGDSMSGLGKAFGVGFLLMFLILVLQFNSLKYSVIVMSSTLLSIIGALFTLGFTGMPLSFPAQLGLFGVIGVGINNAILFIDTFFKEKDKIDIHNADSLRKLIVQTVQARFSPIFLTSATTIAGLITLAIKDALWGSLAIAFIGGLLLNIVMVVLYLPAVIYVMEAKNN